MGSLTLATHRDYLSSVTEKDVTGLGGLMKAAMSRNVFRSAAFLRLVAPSMGGPGGRAARLAGAFPVRQSRSVPPTSLGGVVRGSFNELEKASMSTQSQGAPAPIVFDFNSTEVRIIDRDGEPWFVASDVCKALGYTNTSKAVGDHLDADERSSALVPTPNAPLGVPTNIVSESGLYALVLRSRKPEARKFAKWVTSEVLPAIRKTGSYVSDGKHDMAKALESANVAASAVQQQVFKELCEGSIGFIHQRYLLSFRFTREGSVPTVQMLEDGACVASLDSLARMIAEPGAPMPTNSELTNLARACIDRLAMRMGNQKGHKA